MSLGVNINLKPDELVIMFSKVITGLVNKHLDILLILSAVLVVGLFLLIVFGVCFGMCCYACTKRRSKRLCMFCCRVCRNTFCGDDFNFEEGSDVKDQEHYMIGEYRESNLDKRKSRSLLSNEAFDRGNGDETPV